MLGRHEFNVVKPSKRKCELRRRHRRLMQNTWDVFEMDISCEGNETETRHLESYVKPNVTALPQVFLCHQVSKETF